MRRRAHYDGLRLLTVRSLVPPFRFSVFGDWTAWTAEAAGADATNQNEERYCDKQYCGPCLDFTAISGIRCVAIAVVPALILILKEERVAAPSVYVATIHLRG